MAGQLSNQAAQQFEESYGGEGGDGGLNDEDSAMLSKFLEQTCLNDELRTGRLDLFSVNAPSSYAEGCNDFMFTANAQVGDPQTNAQVEYSILCPEPIDLTSVMITAQITIQFAAATVAGTPCGLLHHWQHIATQEKVHCGDNLGVVNAQNQTSIPQRQMLAYVRNAAKATRTAVEQQGPVQGYTWQPPPVDGARVNGAVRMMPADVQVDLSGPQTTAVKTYTAVYQPNCDFFNCLKLLPPSTRLRLIYQWTAQDLRACFTALQGTPAEVTAANAALDAATIKFRIVDIRASMIRLRRDIKENIMEDFQTSADSLALGLTQWGHPDMRNPANGLKPNLMNPAALAMTGRGRPYQFKDYTYHRFNTVTGTRINFGPVPTGSRPRRVFVFPFWTPDTVAPYFWPVNPTVQKIVGIQLFVNGIPFYPIPLNPSTTTALAYSLTMRDLGYFGDRYSGMHVDYSEWLRRSSFYVFDLSSTRLESEIEGPDASTVALTIDFQDATGGGAIVIGEYDQAGILDDRRNYVNYTII